MSALFGNRQEEINYQVSFHGDFWIALTWTAILEVGVYYHVSELHQSECRSPCLTICGWARVYFKECDFLFLSPASALYSEIKMVVTSPHCMHVLLFLSNFLRSKCTHLSLTVLFSLLLTKARNADHFHFNFCPRSFCGKWIRCC